VEEEVPRHPRLQGPAEDEVRKLGLIVEVARELWGRNEVA
jgi:hypothetical protein